MKAAVLLGALAGAMLCGRLHAQQAVHGATPDTARAFHASVQDTTLEPVLVELRIGHLASSTVQAYRLRTEVLLPLSQLLSLAEVRHHLSADGVLEATLTPQRRLVVAANRDTMIFGDQRVRLEPEYRLFRAGELYVGAERLGNLLGTRIIVDWTDLAVTITDAGSLPIGRRVQREAARDGLLRRQAGAPVDFALGLESRRIDGLVLDYSLFLPGGQPPGGGAYAVALGADVYGGALMLGAHTLGRADAGVLRGDGSWTGVWEQNRYVRQLRLGDGFSTGPRIQSLRGVAVSNSPFQRDPNIGASRFAGRLEPGWSIEAYQGGQLVAFDTTDVSGRFGFRIPIRYGENPVDFVAYGPLGEQRQFYRTYRVLGDLLPARRFEYGLSAGDCRDARCRGTGNLDVRYGLTDRVTVEAGADRFWRDSLADLWHPYASVTATPSNALALEVEGVGNGLGRASVVFEPSLNLRVSADAAVFDTRPERPILTAAGQHSQWSVGGFFRPIPELGVFYLEGRLDQLHTTDVTITRARLGASVQSGNVRVLPYARSERQSSKVGAGTTQPFVGVSAFVLVGPQAGRWLGGSFLRTALESQVLVGAARMTQASAFVSKSIASGLHLEGGIGWQRGTRGPFVQLTLNTYLPAVRSYTTLTAPAGAPATASQLVQGSVLWSGPGGGLTTAPGPSIERSGIAGRVFEDENGNGHWDAGEPPVPDVRVVVGSHTAISDSTGEFRIWDLIPFEPVPVFVDSLSIVTPLLVPAFGVATIVPNPNRFRTLEVPLVTASVIEGRVLREVGGVREPAGAVSLILTDRRGGVPRRFQSFSDGTFYLMGVKPGEYTLGVETRALTALGMTLEPLALTVPLQPGAAGPGGLDLVLRPAP